jgi:hypothetical protein
MGLVGWIHYPLLHMDFFRSASLIYFSKSIDPVRVNYLKGDSDR